MFGEICLLKTNILFAVSSYLQKWSYARVPQQYRSKHTFLDAALTGEVPLPQSERRNGSFYIFMPAQRKRAEL